MATITDVAKHLFMSRQAAYDLVTRGVIPDCSGKDHDIDAAREGYVLHLRAVAGNRGGNADGELDLNEERARKAKEEADRLEMQNALLRGELLQREDVNTAVVGAFARVRARMIGVPSKVAPLVAAVENPAEVEGTIRKAIYEALKELSDTSVADLSRDNGDLVEDTTAAAGPDS